MRGLHAGLDLTGSHADIKLAELETMGHGGGLKILQSACHTMPGRGMVSDGVLGDFPSTLLCRARRVSEQWQVGGRCDPVNL